jgi:hypothetical protein
LTVVFSSSDKTKLTVTVAGTTYSPTSGYAAAATVKALVQKQDPALPTGLGWKTVGETTLSPSNPVGQWSGPVTLPTARGSQPYRLVIQEWENYSKGGTRLVYADAVAL